MKLTVLLDNNTYTDRYFQGEPGLSYFIEADGQKVLFDVGYSDTFLKNAHKLGVNLYDLDYVVLSHGHLDHTWGLFALIQHFTEGFLEGQTVKRPCLVAHPAVLASRKYRKMPEIGSLLTAEKLAAFFDVQLRREPRPLTEHLLYLGEIPRVTDFEAREPLGQVVKGGQARDDDLRDDTALVYRAPDGLVVITGCSHSGICNIVGHARAICGDERVAEIIGGFHLQKPSREQLAGTIAYLSAVEPGAVHACHCTDLLSKIALAGSLPLQEVGVGLALAF